MGFSAQPFSKGTWFAVLHSSLAVTDLSQGFDSDSSLLAFSGITKHARISQVMEAPYQHLHRQRKPQAAFSSRIC